MAIYAIGIGISSYKWKILSDFKEFKVGFIDLFKIYLTGAFINNFFPSIIGGDAYRSYMLGKAEEKRYMENLKKEEDDCSKDNDKKTIQMIRNRISA